MKRLIACLFIILAYNFPLITHAQPASQPPDKSKWPKYMSLATARAGSSLYTITAGITTIITEKLGIKTVPESGSLGQMVIMVHKGDRELGDLQGYGLYIAGRGEKRYETYGPMKVRQLWQGYTAASAFITRRSSGIMTAKDLKGKKVMCIYKGNPDIEEGGRLILEAAGLTWKDMVAMRYTGRNEGWPAVKEGRVDSFTFPVGGGQGVPPWVKQGDLEEPIRLISAPKENIIATAAKHPYADVITVRAEVFGDLVDNKDMPTIGIPHFVYCYSGLPTDLVYEIMKATWSNLDRILKFHPDAKVFMGAPLAKAVIPYHEGAVKYWKEAGKWNADLDAKQQKLLKETAQ